MKITTKISMIAFCLVSIIGCSGIMHEGLWPLKKGLPAEKVLELVDDNSGTDCLEINDKNISSINLKSDATKKYTVIIGRKYMNFAKQYYIYAFENDKLIYWGTPLEFARHSNALINQIGTECVPMIEKDME